MNHFKPFPVISNDSNSKESKESKKFVLKNIGGYFDPGWEWSLPRIPRIISTGLYRSIMMSLKNVKYVNPHNIMRCIREKRKFPQISNTILGTFLAISRPGTTFIQFVIKFCNIFRKFGQGFPSPQGFPNFLDNSPPGKKITYKLKRKNKLSYMLSLSHTHTHTTFTKMWNVKTFHLVETKVEKLQNTVGSFQFGAFHIWPFHILGIYFDHSDMGDSSHLIGRHILGHNSRTRVFLDMRFLQNDGESSPLTLYTKLDKSLEQFWRKMTKTPFWPPFWPKTAEPEFFLKIGLRHFLASMVPWLHAKKNPDKSVDPHNFFEKTNKWLTDRVTYYYWQLTNWFYFTIIWTVLNHFQSNLMTQIRSWV